MPSPTVPASSATHRLALNLIAGTTMGLLTVITVVSFGTVIFSGTFSAALPFGIGLLLLSATVVSLIGTSLSSYRAIVTTVSEPAIPVLSLVARQIAVSMPDATSEDRLFTLSATIILNTLIVGILFFVLGRFKLGGFVRFIPYPVVGGFLAGTGALLVEGALHSVSGLDFHHLTLAAFFQPIVLLQLIPAILFAIAMFAIPRRVSHVLVIPSIIASAFLLFYAGLSWTSTSIATAQTQGLMLSAIPAGGLYQFPLVSAIGQANWRVVIQQIPSLAALWLVDTIALLLNGNGIELIAGRDLNLNHELKVSGLATFVSGIGGGIGGFSSTGENNLTQHLGGTGRLVGWTIAAICFAMMIGGAAILGFVPKFVLIGIPLLLGLEFFYEWFYQAWFRFPFWDYAIIILITLVTVTIGYLPGIAVGLMAAIAVFVIRYSQLSVTRRVGSGAYQHSNVLRTPEAMAILETAGEQIYILELQGLIFFGTANKLLEDIRDRVTQSMLTPVRFVILDFRLVRGLDASAVLSFAKLKQVAQQKQICLVFTDLPHQALKQLRQGGCLDPNDPLSQGFEDLDRGLEWCEQQILQSNPSQPWVGRSLSSYLTESFLDPHQVDRLMERLTVRELAAGDYLFHQGDPFDGLYFVGTGQVSVVAELGPGYTKRIRTYTVGSTIGEMGLYRKTVRIASVVADKPSLIYCLPTAVFEHIEVNDPLLASNIHRFIVNLLAERLQHREQELNHLLRST